MQLLSDEIRVGLLPNDWRNRGRFGIIEKVRKMVDQYLEIYDTNLWSQS